MTVSELIVALQAVPNPSVTETGISGVVFDDAVSGGIELEDGGSITLTPEI